MVLVWAIQASLPVDKFVRGKFYANGGAGKSVKNSVDNSFI
jgi:hypothetical protein